MKTLHALPALLLALATPFAIALPTARTSSPAQRVPLGKTEVEHVGQVPRLYEVRDLMSEFAREYPPSKLGVIES